MMMPQIDFQVDILPNHENVNEEGELVFSIHVTNACPDDDLEKSITNMVKLWEIEDFEPEVTMNINVRVRSIYENMLDYVGPDGVIDPKGREKFTALKKDCQWIINQIKDRESSQKT